MFNSKRTFGLMTVAGLVTAALSASPEARACGGLFCSASAPVNQAAERIVFAYDEEAGRTTAVVEILYQGPSENFAWMLPVPGQPTLGVSTNALLNQLQQATNPNYQLQRDWQGSGCDEDRDFPQGAGAPSAEFGSDVLLGGDGAVSVLDAGTVGPYDYRVLSVDPEFGGDPAQVALDWLEAEGYDVGATAPDVLRPYFEAGMNLAAIRLSKDADTGSIRPIRISYDSERPMIPIQPTGLAAENDMGVLVWTLSSSRAVPVNYKTLELNEALIDWFNPQQSYNDVVIAAANEAASGQGFVTEMARPTVDAQRGDLADQIFQQRFQIEDFRRVADELADRELVIQLIRNTQVFGGGGFGGPFAPATTFDGVTALDGVTDVISQTLTLPPGVSPTDVLAAPECYLQTPEQAEDFYCRGQVAPEEPIDLSQFDRAAFLTAVEEQVFQPLEETVQLFRDHEYVTRFYTTLSPEEMTVDPEFDLNPDLPDVDNQHQLTITYQEGCFGDTSGAWEAEVGGRLVRGEGNTWPLTLAERPDDMPVNLRVLQLSTVGAGQVESDNAEMVTSLLAEQFGTAAAGPSGSGMPGETPTPMDPTNPMDPMGMDPSTPDTPGEEAASTFRSSGGCSLGGAGGSLPTPSGLAWLALGVAGVWLRRRG